MEFYCVFPLELLSLLYPRTTRQYKASLSLGSGSLCDSRRVVEARRGSVLRVSPSRALLGRRSVVYVALTWCNAFFNCASVMIGLAAAWGRGLLGLNSGPRLFD